MSAAVEKISIAPEVGPWGPLPKWVLLHPDLEPRDIQVYGLLAIKRDWTTATTWPLRWEDLADDLDCSTPTVGRSIRRLANAGAITVIHRTKGGYNDTSQYLVNLIDPHRVPESGSEGTITDDVSCEQGKEEFSQVVGPITDDSAGPITDDSATTRTFIQNPSKPSYGDLQANQPERDLLTLQKSEWELLCEQLIAECYGHTSIASLSKSKQGQIRHAASELAKAKATPAEIYAMSQFWMNEGDHYLSPTHFSTHFGNSELMGDPDDEDEWHNVFDASNGSSLLTAEYCEVARRDQKEVA